MSADAEFSAHNAQLCISALRSGECFMQPLMEVRMQAVAHRDHALAQLPRTLTRLDMTQHTLVVLETSDPGRKIHQPRTPLQRFLSVTTVDAAVAAVQAGLGFGWLPMYCIKDQLETRELVPLQLPIGDIRRVALNLVWKDVGPMQPEVSTLAELLGSGRGVQVV
jgi:DNA-binding transcriptional LysR family regulator